jgi:hypothetical protein
MRTKKKAQALIELAVFGSIFLMIVGAMLSYGLRYNFMQQANQLAFRRAMKIASDPGRGSGSYTLMMDKHIPNPTDPFAIGSTLPAMASASVIRTGQLDAQPQRPDLKDDLPSTVVDIQESQWNGQTEPFRRFVYASAGFRYEYSSGGGYSEDQVNKYRLLYGEVLPDSDDSPASLRITDSCSGEVTDFASCYEQAARLVDNDMCLKYCNDVNASSGMDCGTICSDAVQLNPPNQVSSVFHPVSGSSGGGPWYAAGYVRHNADTEHPATWYTFPVLDRLFRAISSKGMGFQPDADTEQVRDTSMRRLETSGTSGSVVTREDVMWKDTMRRSFTYNDNLNPSSGREINRPTANDYTDHIASDEYVSEIGGNYTETWTTGKNQ